MSRLVAQGHQVFASNFAGLQVPGVQEWPDPTAWTNLPPGAVLYVDEAQKFFSKASGANVPQCIRDMETIRHYGVRLVVCTQQPSFIHSHLRGLVGKHEHLFRQEGKPSSLIFRWDECKDAPSSSSARRSGDQEKWTHPAQYFGQYTSAAEHHIVRRWSVRKVKAYAALTVALVGVPGILLWALKGGVDQVEHAEAAEHAHQAPTTRPGPSGVQGGGMLASLQGKAAPLTRLQYVERSLPRIAEQPWSAPVYDGRPVVADPHVYCLSTQDTCRCVTEQGTPYALREASCRYIARWGEPYNPHRRPDQEQGAPRAAVAADRIDTAGGSRVAVGAGVPESTPVAPERGALLPVYRPPGG